MRRALLAVSALAVSLALVPGGAATADPADPAATVEARAEEALAVALDVFGQGAPAVERAGAAPVSATEALRDLWRLRDGLSVADRGRADALLARPTDRAADRFGNGYTTTDVAQQCTRSVCLTRARSTVDRATDGFAARALEVMQQVHDHHVDELGWRAPLRDSGSAREGGTRTFDMYLADIGGQGLYGYCAPDDRNPAGAHVTDGFCVLDNDYAAAQFPRNSQDGNLRVTAAHEYLHAIQYAYDATEDGWLFEATATWVEEQYADDVDDNRQYLDTSQLRRPGQVLDRFALGSGSVYGNWILFEHLANRFGRQVVREVWERAAPLRTASVPALAEALRARGTTLRAAYARFAGDNTVPGRSPAYPEGGSWGASAPIARTVTLDRDRRTTGRLVQRVDHLASRTVAVRSRGLAGGARLSVRLDGPAGGSSPAVQAVVHRRDGNLGRRFVPLNGPAGKRTVSFDFASAAVDRVTLSLVNASQRYTCDRGTNLSCGGRSRDDGRQFALTARIVR